MAVEMAEGKNPYAKYKNILAAIHGIPQDPPPTLSAGPHEDVITIDDEVQLAQPAKASPAGALATSSDAASDDGISLGLSARGTALATALSTPRDAAPPRLWSKQFHSFIANILVKDPSGRPPALKAIHDPFVSTDIRIFNDNRGKHPVLRHLAVRYADATAKFREDFLASKESAFGFETDGLGSQFDTFDLFLTAETSAANTARSKESDLYASTVFDGGTRPTTARTIDAGMYDENDDEEDHYSTDDAFEDDDDDNSGAQAVHTGLPSQLAAGTASSKLVAATSTPPGQGDFSKVDSRGKGHHDSPAQHPDSAGGPPSTSVRARDSTASSSNTTEDHHDVQLGESVPVPMARRARSRHGHMRLKTGDESASTGSSNGKPPIPDMSVDRTRRRATPEAEIDSPSQLGLVMRRANLSSRESVKDSADEDGMPSRPSSKVRKKRSKRKKSRERASRVPTPQFVKVGGPGRARVKSSTDGTSIEGMFCPRFQQCSPVVFLLTTLFESTFA